MIYLASPYSFPEHLVEQWRYEVTLRYTASCLRKGEPIFSPIVFGHQFRKYNVPGDFETWQAIDEPMIHACTEFRQLLLPRWEESRGMKHELALAQSLGKIITEVQYEDI